MHGTVPCSFEDAHLSSRSQTIRAVVHHSRGVTSAAPDACPAVWPHRQFDCHSVAKTGPRMPAPPTGHPKRAHPKTNTRNIMKTILILIAAASVAALSSTALAAGKACEKCCKGSCAACCKEKGKVCGKDCCKGE